jgi:hypothetical protein
MAMAMANPAKQRGLIKDSRPVKKPASLRISKIQARRVRSSLRSSALERATQKKVDAITPFPLNEEKDRSSQGGQPP